MFNAKDAREFQKNLKALDNQVKEIGEIIRDSIEANPRVEYVFYALDSANLDCDIPLLTSDQLVLLDKLQEHGYTVHHSWEGLPFVPEDHQDYSYDDVEFDHHGFKISWEEKIWD